MNGRSLAGADLPVILVQDRGLRVPGYRHPLRVVEARVLSHGVARTLHDHGQSICRSLDGIESTDDPPIRCADCPRSDRCTVQVRAEVILGGLPYRLLLTNVSARNFLLFMGTRSMAPLVRIRVLSRGSWGEARFERHDQGGGS
jgi:hypothetical protein